MQSSSHQNMSGVCVSTWTAGDVMALTESWYLAATAQPWDRVDLIVGDPAAHVRSILLSLGPTAAIADQAVAGPSGGGQSFNMVITHRPLLLHGASFLPMTDLKGGAVTTLICFSIALLNAHTDADVAYDGVATVFADLIGLRDTAPLEPCDTGAGEHDIGLGCVGTVDATTLGAFADHVASVLPAGPSGLFVGDDENVTVQRVAVLGGAGDSALEAARAAGVDVYLTVDLRHHPASEHFEGGASALLCGSHWATESPWLPILVRKIHEAARGADVEFRVEASTVATGPWTSHRVTQGGLA